MAGVPCFNDTCSNVISVDGNGRISIDARLDAAGGLVCGTELDDNAGLRANILGNPAPLAAGSVDDCDNTLRLTTDGFLLAQRPQFELLGVPSVKQHVPHNGDESGFSQNITVTNNADCDRMLMVEVVHALQFTASSPGGYKAEVIMTCDIVGKRTLSLDYPLGGYNTEAGSDQRAYQLPHTLLTVINAGEAVVIQTRARADQVDNVVLNTGTWNGYSSRMVVAVLDLAPGDMF